MSNLFNSFSSISTLSNATVIPVVENGQTKKVTAQEFKNFVGQGEPGQGVAPGGNQGQVLAKASGSNYDTVWVNPDSGATGPQGPQGATGPAGVDGATGATGPQGATGAGATGATGPAGVDGATGATGPQGPAGTSVLIVGSTLTNETLPFPYEGSNGDGYITQDSGHLWVYGSGTWTDVGNIVGPVGSTGATGPQGPQGEPGSTATTGDFIFVAGDASLPIGQTMTLSTYRSNSNEESKLTLSPTTESSLLVGGTLKLGTAYGSGFEKYWQFGSDGSIRFPDASIQTTAFTGTAVVSAATTATLGTVIVGHNLSVTSEGTLSAVTSVIGDVAPSDPVEGDQWWDSVLGRSFTYYNGLWVETSPNVGTIGATGPAGPAGGIEGLTVTQDGDTTNVGKSLTENNNTVGSRLKVSTTEIGLEQYLDPDGLNNNQYGRVQVSGNGVRLEVSQELVGSTAYSRLDMAPTGMALSSTDGVSTNTYLFDGNTIVLPNDGIIQQRNSFTRTTDGVVSAATPTVVWTSAVDYISSAKLVIQVECDEVGDTTGWHSQACEAIIACRGYANVYGGSGGDPQMIVYGVVHTSVDPLVTFTVQRNPTTRMVEVVGTPTAAANGGAAVKIHSIEMSTRD